MAPPRFSLFPPPPLLLVRRDILEAAKTLSKVASQGVSQGKIQLTKEVSTGSAKVDSGTASKRGQREGKAPMVEKDIQATHKTKEQIRQEAAGLEEAIRLQAQMDEEVSKRFIYRVEMIMRRRMFYVEQKAKAKRSKPMTQAQQREYRSTFIKNQISWKLSQLKKLSFEELKTEFEKLMKRIESFVSMETEARVKRHGLQHEQETLKKQ
ncbi:hypothetical protein Tco_0491605 [Tanacetum coccineum]